MPSDATSAEETISFHEVDIVTPSQKLLASKLSCNVVQGKSLLLTGMWPFFWQPLNTFNWVVTVCWHFFFFLPWFLQAPTVVERALFSEFWEIYGQCVPGELPNLQMGCFMFLSVHIPAWVLWEIRSYTLSQGRKQRWRFVRYTMMVGVTYLLEYLVLNK